MIQSLGGGRSCFQGTEECFCLLQCILVPVACERAGLSAQATFHAVFHAVG